MFIIRFVIISPDRQYPKYQRLRIFQIFATLLPFHIRACAALENRRSYLREIAPRHQPRDIRPIVRLIPAPLHTVTGRFAGM